MLLLGKSSRNKLLKMGFGRPWWLTSIILATQEAEVRRISIQSQPRQIVHETLSPPPPKKSQKKGWWNGSRYRP
jgi:hypothetical protein